MDNNERDQNIHPLPHFDAEFATPAEYARLYRARGIQVVPACSHAEVKPGQAWKRPLFRSWVEFQEHIVPDETFDKWYGLSGLYTARKNMGVICGRASNNLFVIDLDVHKHAAAGQWWDGLIAVHNNHMGLETPTQRTGGGGLQKLFRGPPGWTPPTCKTPIGVDVRGQGGFAMMAPSMHESGKAYEWLEGLAPDEVDILMAPEWLVEAVDALVLDHGGTSAPRPQNAPAASTAAYSAFGDMTDGREQKMADLVWGSILDWRRESPWKPSEEDSRFKAAQKYTVYEDLVAPRVLDPELTKTEMLEREGRGPTAFWQKWCHAMKRWDEKVAIEATKPAANSREWPEKEGILNRPFQPPLTELPYLDVDQIMAMPDPVWMVDKLINEASLGFVYGPPGSLKTFISLDLALSIAAGLPTWWGRGVNAHGAVIYLCREGTRSLKFRIGAWQQHRKAKASGAPFYLIEKTINFMNPADITILLATVRSIAAKCGQPVRAVFVDTVSRVLPGAEENLQKDMSLFIAACEALQHEFSCIVIGVHHTNKTGTIRGSTVLPGAGDFLLELQREPGSMTGTMVVAKVKDGEDGQQIPFTVTKVELPGVVPRTSLMVDPAPVEARAARAGASKDGLPDRLVCIEILSALALAWFNHAPWSSSDNGARPAVRLIMARWNLKRDPVKTLLSGWMANGIIEYALYDSKAKAFGYRKLTDL